MTADYSTEIRGRPHIVFLFSDTGGGHRSAAEAIIEALELEFPAQTSYEMIDIFGNYAPKLLTRIPAIYPPLSRKPWLLGLIFHGSDGAGRIRLFLKFLWPFVRPNIFQMLDEHPADLFVSVHPLINAPLGHALEKRGADTPYLTVVTDLVTTHATWFWQRSTLTIVPTQKAQERGERIGFPTERLRVVGLPVAERFCRQNAVPHHLNARLLREQLGWSQALPTALLIGGGEGMGPLEEIAEAVDNARLPLNLVVICGRNRQLKERLDAHHWQTPVRVYGFVKEMPAFMQAADFLITKAGPGTISEALTAGLPMILYSRLNGPEEGNVDHVVKNGAGVWAPNSEQVVRSLARWLDNPVERAQAADACLRLAKPEAARKIARIIVQHVRKN